jgi:threonyl-tRNA synthetase
MQKIPFMLIVGEEEKTAPFLSVATDRKEKETSALRLKSLLDSGRRDQKDIKNIYSLT